MNKVFNQFKKNRGASLLEVVIVVAIIVGLIILLMYFLDPAELLKKSKDTRGTSQARELTAAIVRYNIVTSTYPWLVTNEEYNSRIQRADGAFEFDPANPELSFAWIYNLVSEGEMNSSAADRYVKDNDMYIVKPRSNNDELWTCFVPEAEVNIAKAAANCDETNGERLTPERVTDLEPCDTIDGSLPILELGERNLLCVQQ